jgi:hypothetical protein
MPLFSVFFTLAAVRSRLKSGGAVRILVTMKTVVKGIPQTAANC